MRLSNPINDFSVYCSGIAGAENPHDISGGYIIESYARLGNTIGSFMTKRNVRKSIKYPKVPTIEQVRWIQKRYDEFEDILESGWRGEEYFDMSSFAKYYLIQEFLLNRDMELASFFIYKDNDSINKRFFAGPVWDMDGCRGGLIYNIPNCYAMRAGIISPEDSKSASFRSTTYKGVFHSLFKYKEFQNEVKNEYVNVFMPHINQLLGEELDSITSVIQDDWHYDALLWPKEHPLKYYIEDIKAFYNKRKAFFIMDIQMRDSDFYKVILDIPEENTYAYHLLEFHVKKGERLNIPSLEIDKEIQGNQTIHVNKQGKR